MPEGHDEIDVPVDVKVLSGGNLLHEPPVIVALMRPNARPVPVTRLVTLDGPRRFRGRIGAAQS